MIRRLEGVFVFWGLFSLVLAPGLVVAISPTAEQMEMYQQLGPEQQAQALGMLKNSGNATTATKPLSQPEVAIPTRDQKGIKSNHYSDSSKPQRYTKNTLDVREDNTDYIEGEDEGDGTQDPAFQVQENEDVVELKRFGFDLFAGAPTTFAPATDIPIPADFLIGPGDVVMLDLYGRINGHYELVVNRSGSINLPELGPAQVAGLEFSELKQLLQQKIAKEMIGAQATLSMGQLRSIRVFAMGDVNYPGSFTVSALSTMTNALLVSGGVTQIGSLRNVQLIRNGKTVATLDLYDLLLKGDTRNDQRLQPGDVIFVPPLKQSVAVSGEVLRPAIYELKGEQTVAELVSLAGGQLPTAYAQGSQMVRIGADGAKAIVDINLTTKQGKKTKIQDGDVIKIFSVLEEVDQVVTLEGHVDRPGGYQWFEGMQLLDLIPSVNELQVGADLHYVLIRREHFPSGQIEILSVDYEQAQTDPDANIALAARDTVYVFSKGDERAEQLEDLVDELKSQANIEQAQLVVSISGPVKFTGEYPLSNGMTLNELIMAAGGFLQQAYVKNAEITHYLIDENGETRLSNKELVVLADEGAGQDSLILQPFDNVQIRQMPDWNIGESVLIEGEVRFPGRYTITQDDSLHDVLQRAGGLTDKGYPLAGVFMRESLRIKEQKQIDRMAGQLQEEMAAAQLMMAQRIDADKLQSFGVGGELVSQLTNTKAAGRLVIDLEAIIEEKKSLTLRDGDHLVIPQKPEAVTIIGQVNYPTSHIYQKKTNRNKYIDQSGGLTHLADKGLIYVIRADGSVAATQSGWFASAQKIYPGDTIVVPYDVDRVDPLTLWTNVSQIFYQLGVAVAAWNSVGIL